MEIDFTILRHLRKKVGLTIGQLAEKSRVSFSVISKLERNIGNPSIDTLQNLAASLGLTTAGFIALAEPLPTIIKKAAPHETEGFVFELTQINGLTISIGHAKKGSYLFHPERNTKESEICTVEHGKVKIIHSQHEYILEAGESIQFDAYFNHSYEVLEDCRIILIHFNKKELYG